MYGHGDGEGRSKGMGGRGQGGRGGLRLFAKRLALDNADATGYSPSKPRGWTRVRVLPR